MPLQKNDVLKTGRKTDPLNAMTDTDPNEFSEREKFILSYYRSALSSSRRTRLYDIAVGLVSIGCIAMFLAKEEMGYGFVGYALVGGRLFYLIVEGARWNGDFRNIFAKYEAKLKALTDAQKKQASGVEVS